jgi:hypothetical protein
MENRRMVVLFGNSLLMDTVEASLGQNHGLGVMRVHTSVLDVGERLKSLRPDLVIFDLDTPYSKFVLPFLRDYPGVPLLGLGVTHSTVVALSSQRYEVLSANDLVDVIHRQICGEDRAGEGADEETDVQVV